MPLKWLNSASGGTKMSGLLSDFMFMKLFCRMRLNLSAKRRAALLPANLGQGFLYESGKAHANAIGHPKHQFHGGIPQITLYQAEHGFRDAASLGDGVIRELAAFPRFSQEPNNLFADGFIMSDSGHAESLQKRGLDTYFAMVKYHRRKQNTGKGRPFFCKFFATNGREFLFIWWEPVTPKKPPHGESRQMARNNLNNLSK
jgi:hypothetical protein